MGLPQSKEKFSVEAYLAWEAEQETRNEYFDGEVFAMVGARQVHNIATLNVAIAFRSRLKGSPCRVLVAEAKTRVELANCFFYPDVVVTCDARDRTTPNWVSHPLLVVEVLSDSTAAYDRGIKFAAYRKLASLQEYVLVDLASRRVELFRRDATDHWVLYEFGPEDNVEFASLNVSVPMAEILDDTEDPPETTDTPARCPTS